MYLIDKSKNVIRDYPNEFCILFFQTGIHKDNEFGDFIIEENPGKVMSANRKYKAVFKTHKNPIVPFPIY